MSWTGPEYFTHLHVRERSAAISFRRGWTPEYRTWRRGTFASVAKIRQDRGFPVRSFRDLVERVAELAYRNPGTFLLFRGQGEDHRDRNERSKLYPTIFRPAPGQRALRQPLIRERLKRLKDVVDRLKTTADGLGLQGPLSKHDEFWLSVIQHYQLADTPLLDLTQSLRVAASFALWDQVSQKPRRSGFVFVLRFPHPYGSISKFAEQRLVIARLQNLCPPAARRPHYQEGFLAGQWPAGESKERDDNMAHRLIGKYLLVDARGRFWDDVFLPIPYEALIPRADDFGEALAREVATARTAAGEEL